MGSGEVIMRQLALFFAVLAVATCYRSYHGYKVLRTETLSFEKMELLKNFQIQSNLDFWKEPWLGQSADIMVPASRMSEVNDWLSSHNIKFSLMVENVQELVELSQPKNSSARGMFDWTDYYPHDDLNTWIAGLADANTYTFEQDRMWRKTRSPQGGCIGVDPNRNWDFHWGESGVSDNPCTEVFPGDEAFSEIETRNIRDFVQTLEPTPILSHCFHSYSQLWLWPYGYDYDAYPENREELEQMAIDACDAIYSVHGTIFDPINSADLYPAAGAADDWYKGVLGSRFAFTTELRDTGRYGFILPPDQIIESGEEIWAAMEVIIKQLLTL